MGQVVAVSRKVSPCDVQGSCGLSQHSGINGMSSKQYGVNGELQKCMITLTSPEQFWKKTGGVLYTMCTGSRSITSSSNDTGRADWLQLQRQPAGGGL
jgi:hypothetical protein